MSDNLVDGKSQCCHAVFLRVGWAEKLYPKITVSSACITSDNSAEKNNIDINGIFNPSCDFTCASCIFRGCKILTLIPQQFLTISFSNETCVVSQNIVFRSAQLVRKYIRLRLLRILKLRSK